MDTTKVSYTRLRLIVSVFSLLLGGSIYASETITERTILNSIKEFNYNQMPLSFGKLWTTGIGNDTPYGIWKSIKNSGDRHSINWSNLTFYDSYQETVSMNGVLYKCGVLILKINNGEYASLGIMYLSDSNGRIVNMRDNWSRELNPVPEKAKESLRNLVNNWLYKK